MSTVRVESERPSRWLVACAVVAPLVFDVTAFVAGAWRPGYSLVSRPVSALAIGPHGWVMRGAFLLYGLLGALGAVAAAHSLPTSARRRWCCAALLALTPLGVLWAGLFTMAPATLALHNWGVQAAFGSPILALPIVGLVLRGVPGWRRFGVWMIVAGPLLTLALLGGFVQSVPFEQMVGGGGRFGLWQRALLLEVQAWLAALAWLVLRRSAPAKAYKGPAMEGFIANWYAENTRGDAREYQARAQVVAEQVAAGGSILELAPGPGYLAIELAKLGGYRVQGLDISRTFVDIANENARAAGVSIEFRQGNASQMPYPDESFDFVLCRAAFKNFADPVGALNEIHRVLKPGGKASVLDLRKEASPGEITAYVEHMRLSAINTLWTKLTFRFFLLKNAYTREALQRLAAQSRFGNCQVVSGGIEFDLQVAKPGAELRA